MLWPWPPDLRCWYRICGIRRRGPRGPSCRRRSSPSSGGLRVSPIKGFSNFTICERNCVLEVCVRLECHLIKQILTISQCNEPMACVGVCVCVWVQGWLGRPGVRGGESGGVERAHGEGPVSVGASSGHEEPLPGQHDQHCASPQWQRESSLTLCYTLIRTTSSVSYYHYGNAGTIASDGWKWV